MTAADKDTRLRGLPVQSGMLRVNGETIEAPRPSDSFDVFVDSEGALVIVVLDVQGVSESSGNFLGSIRHQARAALETHRPLHEVVNELELQLAVRPGVEAGLVILRLSQRDARVELLNAGMPPVAHAPPGGQLSLHPSLSSPVGRRVGEVHPYELVPLIWGSAWLVLSDGLTSGSHDTQSVLELCANLELETKGMQLAAATSEALRQVLERVLPLARPLRDDATCVFVGADAYGQAARFQSGIEAH